MIQLGNYNTLRILRHTDPGIYLEGDEKTGDILLPKRYVTNEMHDGDEVRGVQMVQWFIKDTAKGITPAGYEDIADGSLFAEFHVTDDAIWTAVKEGTFKGFSLEGFFDVAPEMRQQDIDEIVKELEGKFSAADITNKHDIMSKSRKLSTASASCWRLTRKPSRRSEP